MEIEEIKNKLGYGYYSDIASQQESSDIIGKLVAEIEHLKKPTVFDCEEWLRIPGHGGHHCWNCGMRDGYPFWGQPDKQCKNFRLKKKEVEV